MKMAQRHIHMKNVVHVLRFRRLISLYPGWWVGRIQGAIQGPTLNHNLEKLLPHIP